MITVVLAGAAGCASGQATQDPGSGGGDGVIEPAGTDPPLVGTEWRLVQIIEPSRTWDPPADAEAVLRFDGEGQFSAQACNHYGGTVEIDGAVLRLGEYSGTDMGCAGPLGDVERAFTTVIGAGQGAGQEVSWAVEDGELRLDGAGGHGLRYRERDGVFPRPELTPLLEVRDDTGEYRLAWAAGDDNLIELDWVYRAGPGQPWGFAGIGRYADETVTAPDVLSGDAGANRFVFGAVPLETSRVVVEPAGEGEPVELELFTIPPATTWLAFGGLVEESAAAGSVVVALDGDGRELGRSFELP